MAEKKKIDLSILGAKIEQLTRAELKNIKGGYIEPGESETGAPGGPTGSGSGDYGDDGYKCCWANDPNNCSECEPKAKSDWICVAGAVLTAC